MSSEYSIYKFGDFTIDQEEEKLFWGSEIILLEPMPFKVLLLLVKNVGRILNKNEILDSVWEGTSVSEGSLSVVISKIRDVLKDEAKNPKYVENIPRKGYRFIAEVVVSKKEKDNSLLVIKNLPSKQESDASSEIDLVIPEKPDNQHFPFIFSASLAYGLLFGLVLLLESAYKFESYTPNIYKHFFGLIVWNGGTMFCALLWMQEFLKKNKSYSVFFGSLLLCFGVFLSYLIASYILPDIPITLTRFQSQTALAAFLKNEFYILFLGIVFVLYPFYSVCGKQMRKTVFILSPQSLLGILILLLAYHIPATFYLSDNLLPSINQGFFIRLLFLRSLIYFGLGFGGLIWYFSQIGNGTLKIGKLQMASTAIMAAFGFALFLITHSNSNLPQIHRVEITSKRDEANQLFVRISGKNFQPNVVQVRVVTPNGDGCPSSNPCKVDNGALKKHSQIEVENIENVPLRLPHGEYDLFVQNGDSPMSNPVKLFVP